MSDIKLFRTSNGTVEELKGTSVDGREVLQKLIEQHSKISWHPLSRIRALPAKFTGGRIDTLGIDENGCPVIIEYKRSAQRERHNQGLFYLDG